MKITATYKGTAIPEGSLPTYANGQFVFSQLDAHGGTLVISVVPQGEKGGTAGTRSSETNT